MSLLNVLAIATHKGGVGKTTTAINLSHALARLGERVLLIDLDPQAHASRSLGVELGYEEPCVADLLTRRDRPAVESIIVGGVRENLSLLPSSIRLASSAEAAIHLVRRECLLKEIIEPLRDSYDYIIVDTAPGLGVLMANAVEAADRIIIPVDSGARSVDGVNDFLDMVRDLRGPTFRRWRILRTMVNRSATRTEKDLIDRLKMFEKRILSTSIHRNELANRSHYRAETLFDRSAGSQPAKEYAELSAEVRAMNAD